MTVFRLVLDLCSVLIAPLLEALWICAMLEVVGLVVIVATAIDIIPRNRTNPRTALAFNQLSNFRPSSSDALR
jgi:hypothetical protein